MHAIVLFLLAALAPMQGNGTPELLSLGPIKAVTFPFSKSPDGRFVLAWTLLPRDPHDRSFDWSGWSADQPMEIVKTRAGDDALYNETHTSRYVLHDIFVDLARHRWADLPSDLPSFYGKGFGPPTLQCEPSPTGATHALVQNPGHFGSLDLWLVAIGKAISVRPGSRAANEAVDKLLVAKYGKVYGGQTWFGIASEKLPTAFHGGVVDVDFDSGTERDSTLKGTLTIRLSDGKIMAAK
jgi:hypothetical protein